MHYGIDIGGTKTAFAVFDARFDKVDERHIETDVANYSALQNSIARFAKDTDSKYGSDSTIGVGVNGIVDADGRSYSVNVPCVNGKLFQKDLANKLGRGVTCINDVRAFALSEARGGSGDEFEIVVGVILGTGAMSALCVGGIPQAGAHGQSGEWGHLPVAATLIDRYGLPLYDCGCGSVACAECYVSGPGLTRIASHICGTETDSKKCIDDMRQGSAHARKAFDIWTDFVAASFAQIILHCDPEIIVLGGGMSQIKELYERLPVLLEAQLFDKVALPVILPARFGATSGVRGAAIAGAGL